MNFQPTHKTRTFCFLSWYSTRAVAMFLTLIALASLSSWVVMVSAELPANYTSLAANAKMDILWEKVLENPKSGRLNTKIQLIPIFFKNASATFDRMSDEFASQRNKLIHAVGIIGKATFEVTSSSKYSGIFKTGCQNTMVRFSFAQRQRSSKCNPGIAVKFLRNNVQSGNFVAMYRLSGQTVGNFFENEFSNHVPKLPISPPGFLKATKYVNMVGLSDIAKYDEQGKLTNDLQFPFALILVPDANIRTKFASAGTDTPLTETVGTLAPGTKLYDVYAKALPTSNERTLIGSITLTSKLVTSFYGDRMWFLRHQRMDDDFALKPEWEKQLLANETIQVATKQQEQDTNNDFRRHLQQKKCPFGYS